MRQLKYNFTQLFGCAVAAGMRGFGARFPPEGQSSPPSTASYRSPFRFPASVWFKLSPPVCPVLAEWCVGKAEPFAVVLVRI